jgi:hypothetical protein
MCFDEEWIPSACLIAHRLHENTFDQRAVAALPCDNFRPSASSRICGFTSVSFRGDANAGSLTYTSAGAVGESIANATL